jgi:hypothetical protein
VGAEAYQKIPLRKQLSPSDSSMSNSVHHCSRFETNPF